MSIFAEVEPDMITKIDRLMSLGASVSFYSRQESKVCRVTFGQDTYAGGELRIVGLGPTMHAAFAKACKRGDPLWSILQDNPTALDAS